MIPKIIHYTWFSGDPFPPHIQKWMKTWKEKLPDYEFRLWDMERLKEVNSRFANEAVSVRKWAQAADVTRLYAVYKYGGIWLDTDVELFGSLDPFLDNEVFIGRELYLHNRPRERWLTAHCFGAVAGHPFIKDCLDYYKDRPFIQCTNMVYPESMRYHIVFLPEVMAVAALKRNYDWSGQRDDEQILDENIHVYPSYYFDSPGYRSMDGVVLIHRTLGGWRVGNEDALPDYSLTNSKKKDFRYFGKRINNFLERHGYAIEHLPKLRNFDNEKK